MQLIVTKLVNRHSDGFIFKNEKNNLPYKKNTFRREKNYFSMP